MPGKGTEGGGKEARPTDAKQSQTGGGSTASPQTAADRLKLNASNALDAEEKLGNIASLIAAGESERDAIRQVRSGRFELPSTARSFSDADAIDTYGSRENIRATAQKLRIGVRGDSDAALATRISSYYSGTGMKAGASGSAERAAAINRIRILDPNRKLPTPDEAYRSLLSKHS